MQTKTCIVPYKGGCSLLASIYKNTYKGFRSHKRKVQSHTLEKNELEEYRIIVSEEFLDQCIFPFEAALNNTLENVLSKMTAMLVTGLFKDSQIKHEKSGQIYG